MNYIQRLDEIKKGRVSSIYLLHGEEDYFIRQFEQAIIHAVLDPDQLDTNLVTFDHDLPVNELIGLIETVPFMGGKNLILLRGTSFFRSRKNSDSEEGDGDYTDERLLHIFENMPAYTHVIFSSTDKVDKRRKLYKQVEKYGVTIELSYLKTKDVRGWLVAKLAELNKTMANDAIDYFVSVTSMMPQISLGFLSSEMEKAALFSGEKKSISKKDIIETMSSLPEVSVFAMVEALSQKQIGKTLNLLGEQLSAGEHPLKIIALLARQVRLMWRAKTMVSEGYGSREIAERLGLVPFIAEKTIRQAQGFNVEKLKDAMLALARADYELKSSRGSCISLERIVVEMCS